MPTDLPPSDESSEKSGGDGPKIVALIFVALLVAGCIWLFHSLNAANDKLNCVASGRTNCESLEQ